MAIRMPAVVPLIVRLIEVLVDSVPRDTVSEGPDKGKEIHGVYQEKVVTAYFAAFEDSEFTSKLDADTLKLAKTHNTDCKYKKPCGKCRRCLWQVCMEAAKAEGKIIVVPRSKNDDDGETTRSWVRFYRPGEIAPPKAKVDLKAVFARL